MKLWQSIVDTILDILAIIFIAIVLGSLIPYAWHKYSPPTAQELELQWEGIEK